MASVAREGGHGCVLILRNRSGRMYAVKELLDNPKSGKRAGHFSLPFETQLPEESEEETLSRLLLEEVDGSGTLSLAGLRALRRLGDVTVGEVEAHVFAADLPLELEGASFAGTCAGTEYEPLGFLEPEALLRGCRPGVLEALALLARA